MSAWILPVSHIDAIVTTAVKGYKASKDSDWRTIRNGVEVPVYLAGETVAWKSGFPATDAHDEGLIQASEATAIGQMLINANAVSVDARYGERNKRARYTYTGRGRILTLGELAQAIGSLDYQSCEVDSWYTSKARRWLDRVELAIYHRIPTSAIPGYTGKCHVIEGRAA